MDLTLEMFENAIKSLKEPREPPPLIMSKSYYEKGVELFGKEVLDAELERRNVKIVNGFNTTNNL